MHLLESWCGYYIGVLVSGWWMIVSIEVSFDITVWMKGSCAPVWNIAGFSSSLAWKSTFGHGGLKAAEALPWKTY